VAGVAFAHGKWVIELTVQPHSKSVLVHPSMTIHYLTQACSYVHDDCKES